MKEIKIEQSKEQIVYEITKEELEVIKIKERNKGRYDIISYLQFTIKNYRYKLNFKGLVLLFENLVDFLIDRTNMIENIYNYSFDDYIRNTKR